MDIPARDFYRYLVLCGRGPTAIAGVFDQNALMLPPRNEAYYHAQVQWAYSLLGTRKLPVSVALRHAGMHDMWAAYKRRKAGGPCRSAYHIASLVNLRKPVETMLLAGFAPHEIALAVNKSLNHYVEISAEDIEAYHRYFFQSRHLSAQDRQLLVLKEEHLRLALVGLPTDLLLHALGLRYNEHTNQVDRAYDLALRKWLIHLEAMPIRLDREGVKSLASFLNSLKGLDRAVDRNADDLPLVKIVRGEHLALEENLPRWDIDT